MLIWRPHLVRSRAPLFILILKSAVTGKKKEGLGGRGSGDINLPRDTKCVKYFSLCIVTATGEMETKKGVR